MVLQTRLRLQPEGVPPARRHVIAAALDRSVLGKEHLSSRRVVAYPGRMVYRDSRRDCPRCGSALVLTPEVGAGAKTCVACRGSFIPHAALRADHAPIASRITSSRSAVPLDPLACPTCGETMRRTAVDTGGTDVRLDFCNAHGVWLDDRELDQLLEGLAKPSAGRESR
jgi:Zn-finger nucleic acid-binding protein